MKMLDRRRDVVNFCISYNHLRPRQSAKGADPIPRYRHRPKSENFGETISSKAVSSGDCLTSAA